MPHRAASRGRARQGARQPSLRSSPGRATAGARRKLGSSHRLIAPAHSLTLPSIDGVKTNFEVLYGFHGALAPAQVLLEKGLLTDKHLSMSGSVVEALSKALTDIVESASPPGGADEFGVEVHLSDKLDHRGASEHVLFFVWANTDGPEYIPLRPVFEQLNGNPNQERLMASLYHWLYQTSQRVFFTFGFDQARDVYNWQKALYTDARETGEDVDLEGEVEFADPSTVVEYIRRSKKLMLRASEIEPAFLSIQDTELRIAFEKAHRMFLRSRGLWLPNQSAECRKILEDAEYYMDGDSIPALGISHYRDDAIVAWMDKYCNDHFEGGLDVRPPIIRCFRANDLRHFSQIVRALPRMVEAVYALSDWVRIASAMEVAAGYEAERGESCE